MGISAQMLQRAPRLSDKEGLSNVTYASSACSPPSGDAPAASCAAGARRLMPSPRPAARMPAEETPVPAGRDHEHQDAQPGLYRPDEPGPVDQPDQVVRDEPAAVVDVEAAAGQPRCHRTPATSQGAGRAAPEPWHGCRHLVQPDLGDRPGPVKPREPACVTGAMAAITITPPAHRYSACHGPGRRGPPLPELVRSADAGRADSLRQPVIRPGNHARVVPIDDAGRQGPPSSPQGGPSAQ